MAKENHLNDRVDGLVGVIGFKRRWRSPTSLTWGGRHQQLRWPWGSERWRKWWSCSPRGSRLERRNPARAGSVSPAASSGSKKTSLKHFNISCPTWRQVCNLREEGCFGSAGSFRWLPPCAAWRTRGTIGFFAGCITGGRGSGAIFGNAGGSIGGKADNWLGWVRGSKVGRFGWDEYVPFCLTPPYPGFTPDRRNCSRSFRSLATWDTECGWGGAWSWRSPSCWSWGRGWGGTGACQLCAEVRAISAAVGLQHCPWFRSLWWALERDQCGITIRNSQSRLSSIR